MENAKSLQKKSTKNFLNKLFNSSSKKNSSTVSPQSEWFPSFTVSDNNVTDHVNSPYSHATPSSRHSNEEIYQQQPQSTTTTTTTTTMGPQRRFSFSNVHESGRQRMLAAKRAEYQEKMQAFDDLIQRRRGSTLRLALTPDVASY